MNNAMTIDALTLSQSEEVFKNMKPWHRPTAAQIRNAVLDQAFLTPGKAADDKDSAFLASTTDGFVGAVKAGRLFDFGHIPNSVLRSESLRAGELFRAGYIGHPFSDVYCIFHTWDADDVGGPDERDRAREVRLGEVGALYMVDPMDMHAATDGVCPPGTFGVFEAEAALVFGRPSLLIRDGAYVAIERNPATGKAGFCVVHFAPGALHPIADVTLGAAVANLLDPVLSCLLLLATDGIEVKTAEAPERLNRQRAKNGKPPIPSHYDVRSGPYVTALNTRTKRRGEPKGGHHATPVPHLRRGHLRHLHAMHGGGTTFVRDAVINLKDPDAPLVRSFYQMRTEGRTA